MSPERPSKLPKTTPEDENEEENPKGQRYLLAIEYIGTRFSGSQQQPNLRTVIGVLEEAFAKFIGTAVRVVCSSRTDAGVHALSNVCHVDIERISKRKPDLLLPPHEPHVVKKALNHFLQKKEGDIMVVDVRSVPSNFHARYKALERTYFYRILCGAEPLSSFEKDRAWHVPEELDIASMQAACKVLVGCHDFSSFRASGCQANSPVRTLDELNVTEVPPSPYFPSMTERQQSLLSRENPQADKAESLRSETNLVFGVQRKHRCFVVTARGRAFLYHQVRLLVGVIKQAGIGVLTVSDVERILKAKNVRAASPMAPACGLYLGEVKYDIPSITQTQPSSSILQTKNVDEPSF